MKYMFLTLTLFLASGLAHAKSAQARFNELDRNRDGQISKSEAAQEPALWSRFSSYDKDKDGALSQREFNEYARQ